MRAVVQRVARARVQVAGRTTGEIGPGLLVLVGCGQDDGPADRDYLVNKITSLRIFPDAEDRMNLSVGDVGGSLLLVSQFTLYGDVRKGRRPAFTSALAPEPARMMFDEVVEAFRRTGIPVQTGEFGADMDVEMLGRGPVTILVDSQRTF